MDAYAFLSSFRVSVSITAVGLLSIDILTSEASFFDFPTRAEY